MKRVLQNELISWKNKKEHLPLLLRGARQVGKNYLVEHFGQFYFDNLVVADFERYPHIIPIFRNKNTFERVKASGFNDHKMLNISYMGIL